MEIALKDELSFCDPDTRYVEKAEDCTGDFNCYYMYLHVHASWQYMHHTNQKLLEKLSSAFVEVTTRGYCRLHCTCTNTRQQH